MRKKVAELKLEDLVELYDDETVANVFTYEKMTSVFGSRADQIIVASDKPLWMQDIGACFEETLHRLKDAGIDDEKIQIVTGMVREDECNLEFYGGLTNVDLGYMFPGTIAGIEINEPSTAVPEEGGRAKAAASPQSDRELVAKSLNEQLDSPTKTNGKPHR